MGICRVQCPEIIFKKADISVHALRVLARACPPAVPAHSALISSLPVGLLEQRLNNPCTEEPEGTGELEGVGERLPRLTGVWKTERYLPNALVGLCLYAVRCAMVQLHQNTLRSSASSPSWTRYKNLSGSCRSPVGCLCVVFQAAFWSECLSGVLGALLTAFYRLYCRCYP